MKLRFFLSLLLICIISKIKSQNTTALHNPPRFFVSFTTGHPSFSRTSFNLNNQLNLRFFDMDLWSNHVIEGGGYWLVAKKLSIKGSIGYINTRQFAMATNYMADEDSNRYGLSVFSKETMDYQNEHLFVNIGGKYQLTKIIFIEPSIYFTYNISKPFYGYNNPNIAPYSFYRPIYNFAHSLNDVKVFGNIFLGGEIKIFFAGVYYERNLSAIESRFSFRNVNYSLKYPLWMSMGLKFGYMFEFKKGKAEKRITQ